MVISCQCPMLYIATPSASETEAVQDSKFMVSQLLSSTSLKQTEILKALCQQIILDRKIVCCT